jgi:hypothetical protein
MAISFTTINLANPPGIITKQETLNEIKKMKTQLIHQTARHYINSRFNEKGEYLTHPGTTLLERDTREIFTDYLFRSIDEIIEFLLIDTPSEDSSNNSSLDSEFQNLSNKTFKTPITSDLFDEEIAPIINEIIENSQKEAKILINPIMNILLQKKIIPPNWNIRIIYNINKIFQGIVQKIEATNNQLSSQTNLTLTSSFISYMFQKMSIENLPPSRKILKPNQPERKKRESEKSFSTPQKDELKKEKQELKTKKEGLNSQLAKVKEKIQKLKSLKNKKKGKKLSKQQAEKLKNLSKEQSSLADQIGKIKLQIKALKTNI